MYSREQAYSSHGDRTLVPGQLRGYRYWYLDPGAGLRSIHTVSTWSGTKYGPTAHADDCTLQDRFLWQPGAMSAECIQWEVHRKNTSEAFSWLRGGWLGEAEYVNDDYEIVRCRIHPNEPAPLKNCLARCGFYGRYRPDYDLSHSSINVDGINGDTLSLYPITFGSFKASGRVILGEVGFRAEKVEIEAISFPVLLDSSPDARIGLQATPKLQPTARAIAAMYGASFCLSQQQLIEEFPPNDLSALGIPPPTPPSTPFTPPMIA